jgi:hypothetical protein
MSGERINPYDLISVLHSDIIICQKTRRNSLRKKLSHSDDFEFSWMIELADFFISHEHASYEDRLYAAVYRDDKKQSDMST